MSSDVRASDERLKARRRAVRERIDRLPLPPRWYAQAAHLTTPASDLSRATKAVEEGFGPALRLFEKWRITPADLAAAFGVERAEVEAVLLGPRQAPLVLLMPPAAGALRSAAGAWPAVFALASGAVVLAASALSFITAPAAGGPACTPRRSAHSVICF